MSRDTPPAIARVTVKFLFNCASRALSRLLSSGRKCSKALAYKASMVAVELVNHSAGGVWYFALRLSWRDVCISQASFGLVSCSRRLTLAARLGRFAPARFSALITLW